MGNPDVIYYNRLDSIPVRVLVFRDQVHLYDLNDNRPIISFPLKGSVHEKKWNNFYLYFDEKRSLYIQYSADNILASTLPREVEEANMSVGKRMIRKRTLLIISFILAFFIGLYFLIISLVPYLGSRMISVETEISIGNQLRGVMQKQETVMGMTEDKEGTKKLQAFADRLKLSEKYPIRVTLVKSKIMNAYAVPGGHVVVYTGMLEKIKTPEALAALLSHESSHVNQRHSLKSLLRKAANSIVISIIFGDLGGVTTGILSNADALNELRYSRSLEIEADEKGMDLLLANHVSLDGMRQLMKTLEQAGDLPESLSFLSTHPLTKERLKEAEEFMKEHPQEVRERRDLVDAYNRLTPGPSPRGEGGGAW